MELVVVGAVGSGSVAVAVEELVVAPPAAVVQSSAALDSIKKG